MNDSQRNVRNQINHTLVDSHLKVLPGVGTLSARRLASGDAQVLGGQTNRSGNLHLLLGGNTLDISAH